MAPASTTRSVDETALRALGILGVSGLGVIALYALRSLSMETIVSVLSLGVLFGGASFLIGGLLGFLFGIPRTLQQEEAASAERNDSTSAGKAGERVGYRANTNLEEISDWLTKILVGVGLTQISEIRRTVKSTADYFAAGLGSSGGDPAFALAILLYFAVCGFFFGYLWTRLFLPGLFRQADIGSLNERVGEFEDRLAALNRQQEADAKALALVEGQLNPGPDSPQVNQTELAAAIKGSSPAMRGHIFHRANDIRRDSWVERAKKPRMERTIPVFRALVDADPDGDDYRSHGALGFALKDQRKPDWLAAEAALTKAIEIRGDWRHNGWLFYEINRAICRVMRDTATAQKTRATDEVRAKVLDDLRPAVEVPDIAEWIAREAEIQDWLTRNNVTQEELRLEALG